MQMIDAAQKTLDLQYFIFLVTIPGSSSPSPRYMRPIAAVANATSKVQSELLMITPYLIPGDEGMRMFKDLRQRKVRVRILTRSLESSTVLLAQSGYMQYRSPSCWALSRGPGVRFIATAPGTTRKRCKRICVTSTNDCG